MPEKSHLEAAERRGWPTPDPGGRRAYPSNALDPLYGGMTVREHYAGLAMSAMLSTGAVWDPAALADQSIKVADALISELAARKP